jgi:UDP-3-O-[3-hydroxymyristoyl] glucosamine N-acyltransferase
MCPAADRSRPTRIADLAASLGCSYEGDGERTVEGVASLSEAGPNDLGFVRSDKLGVELAASKAGALIAPAGVDVGGRPVIRSANPGLHFGRAVRLIRPPVVPETGVHASAQVDPSAVVDPQACIGAQCSVGAGARIGAGTVLHPQVVVYPDVEIGSDCTLHARAVVREGTRIGDRVVLQPGVVLGGDGFGYVFDEDGGWEHMPHSGVVVIEDDVEIGANSTVDRSMFGSTRIGRGSKLDNLVMVGHNCQIGDHAVIAAQVGMAGSASLGRRVIMMGQSALAGHQQIGDGVFVGARAAVRGDVAPGTRVWGTPHLEERRWFRSTAVFAKLPQLVKRVRAIEKKLGIGPSRD